MIFRIKPLKWEGMVADCDRYRFIIREDGEQFKLVVEENDDCEGGGITINFLKTVEIAKDQAEQYRNRGLLADLEEVKVEEISIRFDTSFSGFQEFLEYRGFFNKAGERIHPKGQRINDKPFGPIQMDFLKEVK